MRTIDCPKCEHEHEPVGNHEEDEGEFDCEACGFKFLVEIEYDPDYLTRCAVHDFEPWQPGWLKCSFCRSIKQVETESRK